MWWKKAKTRVADVSPEWELYFREREGSSESVLVDLSLKAGAPDPSKPWLMQIKLPLVEQTENGLLASGEAATIDEIENAMPPALGAGGARWAGAVTHGGVRTYSFHAPNDRGLEREAVKAMQRWPQYRAEVIIRRDNEWKHYLSAIYPDEASLRQIEEYRAAEIEMDRFKAMTYQVLEALAAEGDCSKQPRLVEFWLDFPDTDACEGFANWAIQIGFTRGERPKPSMEGRVRLHLTAELEATFGRIHAVERLVIQKALQVRGKYHGWETQVIQAKS